MPARKNGRGQWIYRKWVFDWEGKKVRIFGTPSINTKVAAEAAERAHIARVSVPPRADQKQKEVVTLRRFVEDRWLPKYPAAGNAKNTLRATKVHLRLHILPHLGDVNVADIRGEVLEGWLAKVASTPIERTGEKLRPKSIKNVVGALGVVLGKAQEWGVIAELPKMPRVKVPERSFDWLTSEEGARVVAATPDPEERLLVLFALRTGARAGEQRALEWSDLDLATGRVSFRRSLSDGDSDVRPTKSGKLRHVPLAADLLSALKTARGLQHLQGGRVFPARTVTMMRRVLHAACRRASLRDVRWHDLRHSFASQLVSAGVSIRQVQEWMGHSTITMTMRYAHLAPDQGSAINVLCGADGHPVGTGQRKGGASS